MRNNNHKSYIYPVVPSDLKDLEYHQAIKSIRRFAPANFPMHIAIHQVSMPEEKNPIFYSSSHSHPDEDEVNILISNSSLTYRISLDDEVYEVVAPATVWIPAGLKHSANRVLGEGYFICMRIPVLSLRSNSVRRKKF